MLTMHHWADVSRGLSEMRRIARKRIVLLTIDVEIESEMWLLRDYVPQLVERDRAEFPAIDRVVRELGGSPAVITVPVPADCQDGFLLAFWSRPEAVLDPGARAATSGFARMRRQDEALAVARLEKDLVTGAWDERYGQLRDTPESDVGLRLIVSDAADRS
jgi:hypothetical protein